MRKTLEDIIVKAITFQYQLPNMRLSIPSYKNSVRKDECYKGLNNNDFANAIYNGLIDYSYNDNDINVDSLTPLHKRALLAKIRYDNNASIEEQEKYGFYGEVILHLMLNKFYKTSTLISRGYFYHPIENAETKGFDCFHLIQNAPDLVELWFGEVKFYADGKAAIKSILEKVPTSLSDGYLFKNAITIFDEDADKWNIQQSELLRIATDWKDNPSINVVDEIKKYNMRLVYPMLVICNNIKNKDYNETISGLIDYANNRYASLNIKLSVPFELFFILLPVNDTKTIKQTVIQWISQQVQPK